MQESVLCGVESGDNAKRVRQASGRRRTWPLVGGQRVVRETKQAEEASSKQGNEGHEGGYVEGTFVGDL